MIKTLKSLVFLLFCSFVLWGNGQDILSRNFENIELRIDTLSFSWNKNQVTFQNEKRLSFSYTKNSPLIELRFYPKSENLSNDFIEDVLPSRDYTIIDSLAFVNDSYFSTKIRINDIANSDFSSIRFNTVKGGNKSTLVLPVFPHTNTYATIEPGDGDLFIGEEKSYELITNRPDNIKIDSRWKKEKDYEYRFIRRNDQIEFSIIPSKAGEIKVDLHVSLFSPFLNEENTPAYKIPKQSFNFTVKGSRLSFLRFDKREVIWERDNVDGVELQIDNHRNLQLNKTYRVEATDEAGGPLIAELYTIRRLSNDKILCMFRPYNYHKISESYLFIKDGDNPEFITNINILPEPEINKVSILRKGGTWLNSNQVFPGETVEIRLEGRNLSRTELRFEDLQDVSTDSLIRTESVVHYLIKVPAEIRQKSINIYNRDKKIGVSLDIKEYLNPRDLDFVIVEYGGKPVIANKVTEPILHNGTIGDVTILFDDQYIDEQRKLYGKQYLEIEIRIKDAKNALVERHVIDDIMICPGESSPRYFSYSTKDCMNLPISINDFISNKTHELDNWSKIELIIRHRKGFYDGRGYSHRIEIIKEKNITFDVDLSIPAGLLIKKVGVEGFPGLTGVSLSMLAQFSFYQKGEIQRLRPYKIGAGFLAQNAFNFNPDPEVERDLGIVVLGSVYPTKKEGKFSFPLYAGFGYFLNEERFFYLIGPGIRINF